MLNPTMGHSVYWKDMNMVGLPLETCKTCMRSKEGSKCDSCRTTRTILADYCTRCENETNGECWLGIIPDKSSKCGKLTPKKYGLDNADK